MYAEDFNWLNHSLQPAEIDSSDFRVRVGEGDNAYDASVLNISGTSFGACRHRQSNRYRRAPSLAVLRIIRARGHYPNIILLVAAIRSGKLPLAILAVVPRMGNLILKPFVPVPALIRSR